MEKTIEIPEGYKARIEGNKVILEPKDSEDETIRKELIGFIQDEIDSINRLVSGDYDDRDADDIAHQNWCKKVLAWLEKQGSQNLANSEKTCKDEQKSSWSEEDEYQINTILHGLDLKREIYKKEGNKVEEERYSTRYEWLKSLKERYTWKPSDEQLHYLSWIANIKLGDGVVEQEVSKHLNKLYDDLKKLKG